MAEKLIVQDDQSVKNVGEYFGPGALVEIEDPEEARSLVQRGVLGRATDPEPEPVTEDEDPLDGVVFAHPAAKKAAEDAELEAADFADLEGSGQDGAFTKPDVLALVEVPDDQDEGEE